jgi:hypothetical protein
VPPATRPVSGNNLLFLWALSGRPGANLAQLFKSDWVLDSSRASISVSPRSVKRAPGSLTKKHNS